MSNFPTYTPRSGRPNEPSGAREEFIQKLWTFLGGISATKLRLPGPIGGLLTIDANGDVLATLSPSGVYTFSAEDINFSGDVNFTDNIVVGVPATPAYVQLTSGGIVLGSAFSSPLTIQWFDPINLFGNTLTSPALTATSLAWILSALGGMVPVVGNDPPAVAAGALGKVDLTAQTANIATTALSNTPPAGFYEVEVYIETTTADAAAGTQAVVIGWTDDVGATTSTVIAAHTLAATGRTTGRALVRLASGNVTYAVTNAGGYGTSAYAIFVRVVALG